MIFDNIKKIGKEHGYNLSEINDMAGLGKNVIYSWKNKKPSAENLQKVANVLHVPMEQLIGKDTKEHINIEPILNSQQLYFKNTSLSNHDVKMIQGVLRTFLESDEGQKRLKDHGYTGDNKNE